MQTRKLENSGLEVSAIGLEDTTSQITVKGDRYPQALADLTQR